MAGRRWRSNAFHPPRRPLPKRNERESCEETEDTGFCAESRKSKVTSAMPRSFFTHGEFVAPNGEPLDVGHRLPVWQRERDVLPSIPLQRVRSIAEIDRIEVFLYPRDEVPFEGARIVSKLRGRGNKKEKEEKERGKEESFVKQTIVCHESGASHTDQI